MIELYLLVALSGQVQTFTDIQSACAAYDASPVQVRIYKESVDYHRDTVILKEGQCKPIKQFFEVK